MSIGKKVHPTCGRIVALVQKERERQKLSKYVIAQRSGLSQSMIGRVESGACIPSLDTILRLADALNLDFAETVKQATISSKGKSISSS